MTRDWYKEAILNDKGNIAPLHDEVRSLAKGDPSAMAWIVLRAANDPGAPFEADVVDAMAILYRDRRADFERLRARLKKEAPRVRLMEFDKLVEAAWRFKRWDASP
jgi:hypothetical protein